MVRFNIFLVLILLLFVTGLIACNDSTRLTRAGDPWGADDPGVNPPPVDDGDTTPPDVSAGITASNATPDTGDVVTFSIVATDAVTANLTYNWSDNGAGGTFTGTGNSVTWSIDEAGFYVISVVVGDAAGNTALAFFPIEVIGDVNPPNLGAGIQFSIDNPLAGENVTITVNATDDGTLTYAWSDNGGGGAFTGTGASVQYSNATAGVYVITVTVTDNSGNSSVSSKAVVVLAANNPPTWGEVTLKKDVANPVTTQTVRFYSSADATDPDGDVISYTWGAGGGTLAADAYPKQGQTSTYWSHGTAGDYTVTLTADDGKGGTANLTLDVAVADLPTSFDVVGFETCVACHASFTDWQNTAHGTALETSLGPDNAYGYRNEYCYDCHGAGRSPVGSGGFISLDTTPQFANIQCESCHGGGNPAGMGAGHKPSPWDPALGYIWNETAGEWEEDPTYDGAGGYGCGLCHEGDRHGSFEEWAESGHATFPLLEDGEVGPAGEANCVKCHNGKYYVSIQIDGEAPPTANLLPEDMTEDMHITCSTCHDPHENQFEGQLRIDSTVDQIIPLGDVPVAGGMGNICISCHNGRRTQANMDAAIAGTSSRGMHGNNQGTALYGLAGWEFGGYDYDKEHPHATWNDNSCVTCHMYRRPYISSSEPALWGHHFEPQMITCLACHTDQDEASVEIYKDEFQAEIEALMIQFEETWPAAWKVADTENPGRFLITMRDTDPATGVGPPRSDPVVGNLYRQTWWNWYYINSDASMGVHNPTYSKALIESAIVELEALNAVNFP